MSGTKVTPWRPDYERYQRLICSARLFIVPSSHQIISLRLSRRLCWNFLSKYVKIIISFKAAGLIIPLDRHSFASAAGSHPGSLQGYLCLRRQLLSLSCVAPYFLYIDFWEWFCSSLALPWTRRRSLIMVNGAFIKRRSAFTVIKALNSITKRTAGC